MEDMNLLRVVQESNHHPSNPILDGKMWTFNKNDDDDDDNLKTHKDPNY